MPKANKKRGRRAETKRKLEGANDEPVSSKRQKQHDPTVDNDNARDNDFDVAADYVPLVEKTSYEQHDRPFYGLLDEEEQEYFRKAGEMLELNQFTGPEDRHAFVESVYKQADNKELKLANSQSCSRVLERLIQLSSPTQLKTLFQKFSGNFVPLFQHRFASHCCEGLLTKSAPIVTDELKTPSKDGEAISDGLPKMQELFVNVTTEIEEHLGYLMTNTFASHPLRILLLILSGEPLTASTHKHVLHSRRKEHVSIVGFRENQDESLSQERQVPRTFNIALETIIYTSVAGLDTNQLQALAPHRVGNPILQLLLRLELTKFGKERAKDEKSILHTLLPDKNLTPTSPSGSFITSLTYDTVGSRLLETVLEFAPAKTFKAIYKGFFKNKLSQLSRNDVASYVVCKALCRVGKEDIQEAITNLGPEISSLVDRNRINVVRTLVERAVEREADLAPLADYLNKAFADSNGTYDLTSLLKLNASLPQSTDTTSAAPISDEATNQANTSHHKSTSTKPTTTTSPSLHASLLIQTLLTSPLPLSTPTFTSLTSLPTPLLQTLTRSPIHAPILTTALSIHPHPSPAATPTARRKLIAALYGHFGALALDPSASRVVEAVWPGTRGLAFMRERVAEELAENEAALRAAPAGRRVWRTWAMDVYRRRRREWVMKSREADGEAGGSGSGFVGFPEDDDAASAGAAEDGGAGDVGDRRSAGKIKGKGKHLTALERARERHGREKARREREGARSGGGMSSSGVAAAAA